MSEFLNPLGDIEDPVPEILYSEYEKGPFTECLNCDRNLDSFDGFYEVQKIFKHDRAIWEHAICSECGDELVEDYSEESLDNIQEFLSRMDMKDDAKDQCHLCEEPVKTGREHMIAALCSGDRMILSPMVMCISCLDQLNETLSSETRDSWNDFVNDNVPSVPASREPQSDVPVPGFG